MLHTDYDSKCSIEEKVQVMNLEGHATKMNSQHPNMWRYAPEDWHKAVETAQLKKPFCVTQVSDNKVRKLAVCLPWQQWTETSVWFDDVIISVFCSYVDLWQSL
jgi:hypothetical protein